MNRCPAPDVLTAYGEGVLPEQLEAAVGAHLAACRVCSRLRADLRETALSQPTLEELERLRRRIQMPGGVPARRRVAAIGAIAAALVVGVYLWPRAQAPQAPVTEAVKAPEPAPVYRVEVKAAPLRLPFATALVLRGQTANAQNEAYLKSLGVALEPYRAGRYQEAAAKLKDLAAQHPRAVEPPFYEGVALLLAGDFQAALTALEAARAIGGEALDDDIDWYLAAARERNRDAEGAAVLLKKLCAAEGLHREAACQALAGR